jgi:hypothetical protein
MLISIAVALAVLCAILLLRPFRPERRKSYNEFHQPVSTPIGGMVYGDTGGAAGIGAGGMDGGGCGGDGGGGGC